MMSEKIGLVIWGCKGGYKTFCSNNVVNTGEQVIAQTVKDIRSFIRMHRTGHDFYAIEFTPKYKVFTNYRSSNDSGTGAFIAFTVYVPHDIKLLNMRVMFKEMMDSYFRDYMNPLSNTPLTGKYDDINKFTPILERYEVKPDKPYFRLPSKQDDVPQLVIYDDVSVVDKYFDSPYRPEFYNCQEVMLLSREIYDNPSNYELEFVIKPIVIERISEPEAESKLINNLAGVRLTSLVINDQDLLHTNGNCPLSEADTISFSIEKNPYYQAFSSDSFAQGTTLTVKDAVSKGLLRSRNRKDYEFVMPSRWVPKRYCLPLINSGIEPGKLCGRVFLYNNYKSIELKSQQQGCFFELSGEEITGTFTLGLLPVAITSGRSSYLVLQQGIIPQNIIQSGLYTDITEKIVSKTSKAPDTYLVTMALDDFNLKINTSSNKLSLLIPAQKLSLLRLNFEAEDYNADYDGTNVSFNPAYVTVYVNKDILDENIYNSLRLQFLLGDASYDSIFVKNKKMIGFKLKYDHWLELKNGSKTGRLFFGKDELGYSLSKDADKLTLQAVVILSASKNPVSLMIQKDGRNESLSIGYNHYYIQPRNSLITVDENVARLLDVKSNENIVLKKIVPIEIVNIPDDENKKKDAPVRNITFIHCQNFIVKNSVIKTLASTMSTKRDRLDVYHKDDLVCIIKPGINENCYPGKEKYKFKVYWKDPLHCDVTYQKESFLDKIAKFRHWLFGLGALIVLCGLALFLYPKITGMFANDYEYAITVTPKDGVIDRVSVLPSTLNGYATSESQGNDGSWLVRLKVPSNKTEEIKKSIGTKNVTLSISSKSDGDTSTDLLTNEEFRSFFNGKSDKHEASKEISIELPSTQVLAKLANQGNNVDVNECIQNAGKYPAKAEKFSELAYNATIAGLESLTNEEKKEKLNKFINGFKNSPKSRDALKIQNQIEENINAEKVAIAEAKEAAEQQRREAAEKEKQLKPLREQLNRLDVTFGMAQQVKEKANQLGDTKLAQRAQAYMDFFNARNIDDVKRCMASFSPEQKRICQQTYAKSSDDFKFFQKNCKGMNFTAAKARLKNQ